MTETSKTAPTSRQRLVWNINKNRGRSLHIAIFLDLLLKVCYFSPMPRRGRIDFPGALHHVIIRGINKADVFKDERDREAFIYRLQIGLDKTGVACYAWALIPNHIHLLLRTGSHPLTELMRCLLTGYALYFNRRHNRVGYLFQNRYKSILCQEEAYLLQLVRYIHLNPLRANLVTNLQALNTFRWCGHSVLLGKQAAEWQDSGEILSHFASIVRKARRIYLDFVAKGIDEGKRSDLTGGGLLRSIGGWQGLCELRKLGERQRGDERILGDGDFVQRALNEAKELLTRKESRKISGWSLEKLMCFIEELYGVERDRVQGNKKDSISSRSRALFTWWATEELGFSLTEVARFLNIHNSTVFRAAQRGCEIAQKESLQLPPEYRNM